MNRRLLSAAKNAVSAPIARALARPSPPPRLSSPANSRSGVMTAVPKPTRVPAAIAIALALAGLIALLAWPAFAQNDDTAPSNLTARLVEGGALLNWDAPAEDTESVTGYRILYRRTDLHAPGNFQTLVGDTQSTAPTHTDANANVAGKRYTYRVKAIRGTAASNWSNYAYVDVPGPDPTSTPTATATPAPTPTATAAPTPAATPTATPAPTATPTPTPEPEPLTATFQDLPEGHNGTDTFTFQIKFSEAVNTSYTTLRDSALTVPDGEVTSASRVNGRSDLWRIVVRPDSDANVTVTLPATEDCDATGAVCTEGGKKLSAEVSHTVPGPEPSSSPLTGFTLVDASDQSVLATVTDGIAVELDDPAGGDYAIRADVESGSTIGSVHLALTGAKSVSRTENIAPYSLYGDEGANDLTGGTLPVGSYTLTATAYSQKRAAGSELGTLSVSFTVAEHDPTPVPPTLSASALYDGSGVVLSWNRPAEDAGSVTGYEILRARGSCLMTTLVADTGNQRVAYIDEDATIPGQNYAYQVRTIMGEERSEASNRVEVQLAEETTTADQDASSPVPPTLCAWALPDGRGIVLSWSRPAENADAVTGYEILRALDDEEMAALVADTRSKSVAYIDEATESGKTHAYQVKTIMGEQKSTASNRVEVHVPHDPVDLAPSNLEAATSDEGVALTWSAPAEVADAVTGYEILRVVGDGEMATLVADTQSTALAYTDEEATEGGETYAYLVKAIRGEERSEASNRAEVQVPFDPVDLAPSNLEAVAIQGGVGLDWDAPDADAESITGYRILRSASPEVVLVEDTKSDVTEFIDDTVYDQGLYTYRIEGLRGNVKSDSSNSRTILFLDNEPVAAPQRSAPELLLVKNTNPPGENSAILSQVNGKLAQVFTTGTNEGGYRITSIGAVANSIQTLSTAGDELTATINQGGGTNPGAVLCTLTDPPSFAVVGLQTFTAPADCPTLNPTTAYFFVIERTSGTQHISWESNEHNGEDPGGPGDWSIADGRRSLFSGSWGGDTYSHLIEVRGSLEPPALVKNTSLSGTAIEGMSAGGKIAQGFTTGAHTAGYRVTSIGVVATEIADTATAGSQLTATLNAANGSDPGAVLCTLTDPPAFTSSGIQTLTAPADCPTLRAKRTYFVVIERSSGTEHVRWRLAANDAEDPGRTRDWKIANGNRYVFSGSWHGRDSSLLIEVKGAKVPSGVQVTNTGQTKLPEASIYSLTPEQRPPRRSGRARTNTDTRWPPSPSRSPASMNISGQRAM